jgi:hypothetical protein
MDYAARQLRSVIKKAVNEHLETTDRDYSKRFYAINRPAPTTNKLINAAAKRRQDELKVLYRTKRKETAAIARQSTQDMNRILPGMKRIHEMTSAGMGGIRGLGHVTGSPAVYQSIDGSEGWSYFENNIASADTRNDQILKLKNAHDKLHTPSSGQMRSGHPTQGFHRDHAAVHQGRHIARIKGIKIRRK